MLSVLLTTGLALTAGAQQPADTNSPVTNALAVLPGQQERLLTIQECINLALSNNLNIKISTYSADISRYGLGGDYGAYDPAFTLSATRSHNDTPPTLNVNPAFTFGSSISDTQSYSAGLQGELSSGLTYNFSAPLTRSESQSSLGDVPVNWSSSAGFQGQNSLSQPLLKNFWIDQTREQIQLDKANLKISQQSLRLQIMTIISQVKTAYYNLTFARGNVEANARALQLAQQLAEDNKTKVQVGSLAPLDERQAESQVAASQSSLLSAKQSLLTQQNALKVLLTDNYREWADVVPVPTAQLVAVPETVDRQESWRKALTQRPELIEDKLTLEQKNITLKYTANQLWPELDAVGTYYRSGADSTSITSTLNDVRDGRYASWSFGGVLKLPLGETQARNARKSAQASAKQAVLQLKQEELSIMQAVDNDIGLVQSSYEQVKATREARLYAEDALAAEQTKLANGKSTSFNVLQLISNLTTARVNEIQALANFNNARVQLQQDEGSTLEANDIDFKVR